MQEAKSFKIPKLLIAEAYEKVKANQGAAGVDKVTIADFDKKLKSNLYKLWNRMSSGSYQPMAVRLVEIPKAGGTRNLGIPKLLSYYFYYSWLWECICYNKYKIGFHISI